MLEQAHFRWAKSEQAFIVEDTWLGNTFFSVLYTMTWWVYFSPYSRRIINLGPVMLIPEEQPAQPAIPVQPEGTRVVCGHCGNTFLVSRVQIPYMRGITICPQRTNSFLSSIGFITPLGYSAYVLVFSSASCQSWSQCLGWFPNKMLAFHLRIWFSSV